MKYPRAIFFDLDDTILALNPNVHKCWDIACRECESGKSGVTAERLHAAIDETRVWYWGDPDRHRTARLNLYEARREMVHLAMKSLGIEDTSLASELSEAYTREIEKHMTLFPGALETLQHMRDRKLRLALITNGASAIQRRKIKKFDLADFFDIILIEEEMGVGKPDERIFRHALHKLDVAPRDAWMVGDDMERDIAGAQQLGIFSFWVDSKIDEPPAGIKPDRTIKSISELVLTGAQ